MSESTNTIENQRLHSQMVTQRLEDMRRAVVEEEEGATNLEESSHQPSRIESGHDNRSAVSAQSKLREVNLSGAAIMLRKMSTIRFASSELVLMLRS